MNPKLHAINCLVASAELAIGAHANLYLSALMCGDEVGIAREQKAAFEATTQLLNAKVLTARELLHPVSRFASTNDDAVEPQAIR